MAALLEITEYSHYFKLTRISVRARVAIDQFARRFIQYGFNRNPRSGYTRTALKVFGAATNDRTEFRFHINFLPEFLTLLDRMYLTGDLITRTKAPMYEWLPLDLVVKDKWQPRGEQPQVLKYLSSDTSPKIKFVELQTGKGKSYCAMAGIAMLNGLALIIIKPAYIEKWIEDLHKTYEGLTTDDVMVVRGASQLMSLLHIAVNEGISWKFTIISNKTYQNWLKQYEQYRDGILDQGFPIVPEQLNETLKTRVRLIDEVHQDFHLNHKIDLYTHVPDSISLSATFVADDQFLNRMYEATYPKQERYVGAGYHKYIHSSVVKFYFKNLQKLKWVNSITKMYSHNLLEQSIIKHPETLENYLELIVQSLNISYLPNYKPGHRCLIYGASIDFCTILAKYLQKLYPHLKVSRYVEDDPYENLMESDICVSTLLSAGTGIDIPMLTDVILTPAVSSTQSNIQGFGRLRELLEALIGYKIVPRFLFFCAMNIPKQVEYAEKKIKILQDRALIVDSVQVGKQI